ncbi:CocE/NonD family hydrolase [Oleiagrimonas sp. C23AA]|uniref:CocE/NonD family hydrolase n=1 Tax=Oleiagrimonas sp. C23AA TaxID=2719047 RepID=UPI00142363C9|nr:CocE/NonD family hydrolase [Oleiagrimonas sp. C23AA]NII09506.1 CocE/NonD family hydrolase [Oleiagrimonas sp. C23AA]
MASARFSLSLLSAVVSLALGSSAVAAPSAPPPTHSHYPNLPSETPANFKPVTKAMDYTKRVVQVPMRDGIKLNTVIVIPKGAHNAGIVLERTPYNADHFASNDRESHDAILKAGYIHVYQDVRGKYGSEGDYVMNRYVRGPLNPTPVSDATDASDTIGWLVKHVKQSNGRVAIMGISYDGFEALMGLVHPNPALKAAVPENPMVDGWKGDDWFHNGAFREQMMPYIYSQEATRANKDEWWSNYHDDYTMYLDAGNPSVLAKQHGMEQLGFWNKLVKHSSYDQFWQDQAVDKILAKEPLTVPTMLVAGEWDQEDIYGALAVYRALYAKAGNRQNLYLTLGPWFHGEEAGHGTHLGAIKFGSDTSAYFRKHFLMPFLAQHLKSDGADAHLAHVNAYVTGTNKWEQLPSWPACPGDCSIQHDPIYLQADHGLSFSEPTAGQGKGYDQYISNPDTPVPYRARPVPPAETKTWPQWLVGDQRPAAARPDVETYETPVLKHAVRISGRPMVHLIASTSGTDSDWVVKLIDVYPQQDAKEQDMSGYQLAVAMDIFRGRFRQSLSHPTPLTPNKPLTYGFALPAADHVFLPGHRIMVQIQSSWFPLYDRNPQKFVKNIFKAKPSDYIEATQRIYHSPAHTTYIDLPVAKSK